MRDFYVEVLGFPQVGAFRGHPIIFIDAGTTTIELIKADAASPGAGGAWAHLAFEVDDVDATFAELIEKGVAFHVQPKGFPADEPAARIAFFKDPDGNELELFQPLGSRIPSGE